MDYLGSYFAEHGIGVAMVNYRLSPKIKHPCHVQDVAKAVAWVHANIGSYGGERTKLFLGGHSAGGHLVSLLATDERYLHAEKIGVKAIRDVVSISGAYSADNLPSLEKVFPVVNQKLAFPVHHIKATGPPFLLFRAEKEIFGLDKQAAHFHGELRKAGCRTQLHTIKGTEHSGIRSEAVVRNQIGERIVELVLGGQPVATVGK